MTPNDIRRAVALIDREKELTAFLIELSNSEQSIHVVIGYDTSIVASREKVVKMIAYELGDIHLELMELGINVEDESK